MSVNNPSLTHVLNRVNESSPINSKTFESFYSATILMHYHFKSRIPINRVY